MATSNSKSARQTVKINTEPPPAKPNGQANGPTATDQILNWFEGYVEAHALKVGDALPSEDEIMRATTMGRSSVREAVNQLKALGIVESRRKRGMRLERPPQLLDLIRLLGCRTIPKELVGHVGSFRCALEFGLASEIFRNATPEDVAELRHIVSEMTAHGNEPKIWNQWDCHFHEKMLSIPRNKIAIWLSLILNPFFGAVSDEIPPMIDRVRKLHERIVEGLEQRDFASFFQAVYDHDFNKLSINKDDWPQVVLDYKLPQNNQVDLLHHPSMVNFAKAHKGRAGKQGNGAKSPKPAGARRAARLIAKK